MKKTQTQRTGELTKLQNLGVLMKIYAKNKLNLGKSMRESKKFEI